MSPPAALFGPAPTAVVGHRGAPVSHAENTPDGFAAAAAAGAGWVELDVRRSADGQLAVHHDAHLADGRPVVSVEAAALREAGVWLLPEILAGLPAGLGVDVEVKNLPGEPDHDEGMALVGPLADALAATAPRPLVVSSFNPMVLLALAEGGVDVPMGLLTIAVPLRDGIGVALELGCAGVFCHHTTSGLDAAGVAAAHGAGLAVMVWTVDDPDTAVGLAGAGVDALCTNDPGGVAEALRG